MFSFLFFLIAVVSHLRFINGQSANGLGQFVGVLYELGNFTNIFNWFVYVSQKSDKTRF